jgi:hypothetical protein
MVVEGDGLYYDGHEFISVIEYRGIQIKKIKRNLFLKKLSILNKIRIFVNKVKLKIEIYESTDSSRPTK